MPADAPYTLPLIQAASIAVAGGKGANLGELVRAGFGVPDGFVVTTAAYDRFVAAGVLAPEVADAITRAYAALSGAVAVRSSATAEDLPEASFAGQQDSFLNVAGADEVLDAVRACWASLFTPRAVAYRESRPDLGRLSIAVVVQRFVAAEASGVAFTANPATGRRDETVISAAWGLGEAVVGGRVDPDEYVVTDGAATVRVRVGDKAVMTVAAGDGQGTAEIPTPDARRRFPALTDAQALDLAALARRVEAHFGLPQDIERVLADGALQLVQARPITALPEPTGPTPTDWPVPRPRSLYFRASIIEQMPDPLTPLFADLARTAVPAGLLGLVGEIAPKLGGVDVDFPTINGYAFYDYSRRAFAQLTSFTIPALRLVTTKNLVMDRWRDQELPRYAGIVATWAGRDPAGLGASDLLRGTQELLDAGCSYYSTIQTVIPVASMTELAWTGLYDRLLKGTSDAAASDFLLGLDSAPLAAERSLAALAAWCRDDDALAGALAGDADPLAEAPPPGVDTEIWARWRARLDAHLAEFGHMTYNLDFANPVPADDPAPVLHALRHLLSGAASDPVERQRRQADRRGRLTRDLLGRLGPARAPMAAKALGLAQRWAPVREDALAAMGLAWPVMRRLLREAGRRLVAAGALDAADGVFWLTRAELADLGPRADAGESLPGMSEAIGQRRATWRGQARVTPPQYLPESRAMRSLDSMMPARAQDSGPVLAGTSGTGGCVTGVARVLASPADFAAFAPGEILVASITTPAYTPLFALAGGVVTDIGGVLSHGSIVAREYGIPAVLGTGTATKRIATGDHITVDGAARKVLLDRDAEARS